MSNFIPNETKRIVPRDPPWISKNLKILIKKKNRFYASYKKNGYSDDDRVRLESFRSECKKAVDAAKHDYVTKLGNKLNNPTSNSKSYWKIVNRVMNKSRSSLIPPIIVDNILIVNCIEKCKHFVNYFSNQCKPILNDSVLPSFEFITMKRMCPLVTVRIELGTRLCTILAVSSPSFLFNLGWGRSSANAL